jgi:citrate lyase subunit beta/citryl-CoA lyase
MTYPLRSLLFLPASNPRALEKARTLACDAVVLDLEDSVGPEHKEAARAAAVAAVRTGGFGGRTVAIRVNGLDTDWGEADLAAAAACGPDAVLVPKIDGPDDVDAGEAALAGAPPQTRLWAMIETCRAVLHLEAIAARARQTRLAALVVGVNDLSKDLRCANGGDRAPLTYALSKAVTAARAHGLIALDGVHNDLDDAQGLAAECLQGKTFGFDGKSLIHPNQIEAANRAFAPSPAELAWARRVVEAFAGPDAQGKGVLRVDGAMVERLHLAQAARLLALAEGL